MTEVIVGGQPLLEGGGWRKHGVVVRFSSWS